MEKFTRFNICGSKPQKDNPKKRHFYQVGVLFMDAKGKGSILSHRNPRTRIPRSGPES